MDSVLVGMFDTQAAAEKARTALGMAGIAPAAVTMASGATTASDSDQEGGIMNFFRTMFGDDDTARNTSHGGVYQEAFKRGSSGVSVTTTTQAKVDKAEQILNDCGAVDIDEKSRQWQQDGWKAAPMTGAAPVAQGFVNPVNAANPANTNSGTGKLQELEEALIVGKRAVATGGVRIFSHMTEVPVEETVRLREEHANVERRAVDRPATSADLTALKEGSIKVRAMSEEAVASKTARVVGEVEISKQVSERDETVRDTVRKTKVEVEHIDPKAAAVSASKKMALKAASGGTGKVSYQQNCQS